MATIAPQLNRIENRIENKILPQNNKLKKEVRYPSSDGKPMAETTKHRDVMVDIIYTLIDFFIHSLTTLVSGDNFLYTLKGDPSAAVAPDIYVVFGVPVFPRDTYKVWEEGKPPDFVMEITSPKTFKKDLGSKRNFYEDLGVREYFLFDPKNQAISPPLRGFRLEYGRYNEIDLVNGRLYSEQLGLEFVLTEDKSLRIFHPAKGEFLVLRSEQTARANAEAERAEMEAERAEMEAERANAEAQRANAEAEKAEMEAERANAEAEKARLEAQRADNETQARLEAESEIERLKAELDALRANRK